MSKVVITVPNMSDAGLSAAVVMQFRNLIMDDSDLLVRLNERGLPVRLEHPTSGAVIELVGEEYGEADDSDEPIDRATAQALHAKFREFYPGADDTARYRFTRSKLDALPRWREGDMTKRQARVLFKAMER